MDHFFKYKRQKAVWCVLLVHLVFLFMTNPTLEVCSSRRSILSDRCHSILPEVFMWLVVYTLIALIIGFWRPRKKQNVKSSPDT